MMRVQIKATFESQEYRDRFVKIMQLGDFEVTRLGPDVYCSYEGFIPDCLLRQLPLGVKCEYEARNKAITRRCLEVSGVLPEHEPCCDGCSGCKKHVTVKPLVPE